MHILQLPRHAPLIFPRLEQHRRQNVPRISFHYFLTAHAVLVFSVLYISIVCMYVADPLFTIQSCYCQVVARQPCSASVNLRLIVHSERNRGSADPDQSQHLLLISWTHVMAFSVGAAVSFLVSWLLAWPGYRSIAWTMSQAMVLGCREYAG